MENGEGIFEMSDKNLFEWTALIGKTLTISTSTDSGVTIVWGKGDDGITYILAELIEGKVR